MSQYPRLAVIHYVYLWRLKSKYRVQRANPDECLYIGVRSCLTVGRVDFVDVALEDQHRCGSAVVKAVTREFGNYCFEKAVLAIYLTRQEAESAKRTLHQRLRVDEHPFFFHRAKKAPASSTPKRRHSEETRNRMRQAKLGRRHRPETVEKIRASQRAHWERVRAAREQEG